MGMRSAGAHVRVAWREGEWVRLHPVEGFGTRPAWLLACMLRKRDVEVWHVSSETKALVREAPRAEAKVLGAKMPGSSVRVAYTEGSWARLSAKAVAWMPLADLTPPERAAAAAVDDADVAEEPDEEEFRVEPRPPAQSGGGTDSTTANANSTVRGEAESGVFVGEGSASSAASPQPVAAPVPAARGAGARGLAAEARDDTIPARADNGGAGSSSQPLALRPAAGVAALSAAAQAAATAAAAATASSSTGKRSSEADRPTRTAAEPSGTPPPLRALRDELERVRAEKARAIENEDFDAAKQLKSLQVELEADIAALDLVAVDRRRDALRETIAQLRSEKARAVQEEEFMQAKALAKQIAELEAELPRM